jgi:hypothetical protein
MWLEGLGQLKNSMTTSGMKTVIFRLVATLLPRSPFAKG